MPVPTSANTVECYSTTISCFNVRMFLPQMGTSYQSNTPFLIIDRTRINPKEVVALLWNHLGLPSSALASLSLPGTGLGAPSSFKLGILAQASVGLSALSAALVYGHLNDTSVPKVEVPLQHAVVEFNSSSFLTIDGKPLSLSRTAIGGLHKTADGHVRIHDGFLVHREALKKLLGCSGEDDRDRIAAAVAQWTTIEFEIAALEAGLVLRYECFRGRALWRRRDCAPIALSSSGSCFWILPGDRHCGRTV